MFTSIKQILNLLFSLVYPLKFILNINLFEKVFKIYFQALSILVSIVLIYILYISINDIAFIFILFVVIIFSLILIYLKKIRFKTNSKFINLLLNKDYTFLIQRILIVKFLFFYCYIATDYAYCDSFITRAMHDVFVSIGKSSNVEPQQTVSTMETMGMLATIGLVGYGGIKVYKFCTKTPPKSPPKSYEDTVKEMEERINNRLDVTDKKMDDLSKKLDDVHSSLSSILESDAKASADNLVESVDRIDNELQVVKDSLLSSQDNLGVAIKEDLVNNFDRVESLIKKNNEMTNRYNFSRNDLEEFEGLQKELSTLVRNNDNATPMRLVAPRPNYTRLDRVMQPARGPIRGPIGSNRRVLNNPRNISSPNTTNESLVGQSFEVTAASDTNIVFTAISNVSNPFREITTTVVNRITTRVFHSSSDVILKVLKHQVDNVLQGSITYTAFVTVLKSLGIFVDNPYISENIGKNIVQSINRFIESITRK